MEEKIDALIIRLLDNGTVELEQDYGTGETSTVFLHPIHIRYLFERVGYVTPTVPESQRVKSLEHRLRWMRDQFFEIDSQLPDDLLDRCPEASEFYAWLLSRCFVAGELTDDLNEIEVGKPSSEPTPTGALEQQFELQSCS